MEYYNKKLTTITKTLETLKEGVELFHEYEKIVAHDPSTKNMQIFLGMRDSMIQRFGRCTDLLWKVLKIYLEEVEKVTLAVYSPRSVVRKTVNVRTITESQGEACIEMVKSRNQTSHIYHEETAKDIAQKVPTFYTLMKTIVDKIQERII